MENLQKKQKERKRRWSTNCWNRQKLYKTALQEGTNLAWNKNAQHKIKKLSLATKTADRALKLNTHILLL